MSATTSVRPYSCEHCYILNWSWMRGYAGSKGRQSIPLPDHSMDEMRTVRLPAELCAAAEKKFGHKFASLEELLIFVLQDLSRNDADNADIAEQKLVEERLRELGYL